ncbi:hypothetical protein BKA93DRAFT_732333 [Sparassis latifolia]|uniref:F-box domain-containing protein n=1 Tax=Sparassis crispa TaxID=139825 RepID=A0A401G646_9APHY|nr:hypothetical protein SCP_0105150 [Sparassis crispa]GBE77635.1 hypothetical protein SCP_0105150 [Sparassis crispa]
MSVITRTDVQPILLNPRPLARCSGSFLLLPLLPSRAPAKHVPPELWAKILAFVFEQYNGHYKWSTERDKLKRGLLLVCKELTAVALPLYYAHVRISTLSSLEKFTAHLQSADQMWDSIRRIPYSTPGRWVQELDLHQLKTILTSESYHVDALLTQLFPLVPLLAHLTLNPTIHLSRRVITALSDREGIAHLRILKGIKVHISLRTREDTFVTFLRSCNSLEELEISGQDTDLAELDSLDESDALSLFKPLELSRLRRLVLLSMPHSPVMFALLHSPLPSLHHLVITPYADTLVSNSLVPQFIEAHGQTLTSLHLYTPQTWPSVFSPSPSTLLDTCPRLYHLSLEKPLPALTLSSSSHPLQILSVPRPRQEFYPVLESLLPKLPHLKSIRARDVRWLRSGLSSRAVEAGVQGEMMEWRRRLVRRGIQMLDSECRDGAD